MIVCPRCGRRNSGNPLYCERCGQRLGKKPAKRSRRPELIQFFVLFEAVVIALMIVLFVVYGNTIYSAKGVAEKYCAAYTAGDWETMYGLMDWPDGVFLTEAQYEESMENAGTQTPSSYEIAETGSTQADTKTYVVIFGFSGGESSTEEIVLTLQDDKGLFFFDTWKIETENAVAENCVITVPEGAEAAVDGTILDDSNAEITTSASSALTSGDAEDTEDSDAADEGDEDGGDEESGDSVDTYRITVFSGTHTLQVSCPWYEVKTETFTAGGTDEDTSVSVTAADMELSEEGEQAFCVKAQEALEQLYGGALAGRNFSRLTDLFAGEDAEAAQEDYKTLVQALEDAGLKGVIFSAFSGSAFTNSDGIVEVTLAAHYEASYTENDSSDDDEDDGEKHIAEGEYEMTVTFRYDDDEYKIAGFSMDSVISADQEQEED